MVIIARWFFIAAFALCVGMLIHPAQAGTGDVFIVKKHAKGEDTTQKEPPRKTESRS